MELPGDHTRILEHCTGLWMVQAPHIPLMMVLVLILAFVLNAVRYVDVFKSMKQCGTELKKRKRSNPYPKKGESDFEHH